MKWTHKTLKKALLAKPGSYEDFPFGPEVSVFKVGSKMFALSHPGKTPVRVNLKCYPEEAEIQRTLFPAVTPGYHMNKRHWNTVILNGTIPDALVYEMIDVSYDLVFRSLKKAERDRLAPPTP